MSEQPDEAEPSQDSPTDPHSQDPKRVMALEQRRLWLHHQIQLYRVAVAAAEDRSQRSSDDPEQLLEKISQLEKDLVDVATKQNLKDLILQRLYTGQALSEWLFKPQKGGQGDADGETAQRREIIQCMERQMELTREALQIHKEMTEEQDKADQLKKKRAEKMYENRELLSQLETARKEQESSASAANPQLKRARQKLESSVTGVVLLQDLFRGLILGSGINWAEDEDLCKLALSLGRPISEHLK